MGEGRCRRLGRQPSPRRGGIGRERERDKERLQAIGFGHLVVGFDGLADELPVRLVSLVSRQNCLAKEACPDIRADELDAQRRSCLGSVEPNRRLSRDSGGYRF